MVANHKKWRDPYPEDLYIMIRDPKKVERLIKAAREVAGYTHGNLRGERYAGRKAALAELRDAVVQFGER